YIKPWSRDYADLPGPMVLFATPGMLHIGTSLEVFKKWAPDDRNMLIMPGYCVAGTVGAKVLSGMKVVDIDQYTQVNVNIDVQNLSFSAHADAKGIMELIRQASPRNVVLVHGEKSRMTYLKSKIMGEFGCPCYDPANGELLEIETSQDVKALMSDQLFQESWAREQQRRQGLLQGGAQVAAPITQLPVRGVLMLGDGGKRLTRLLDPSEFAFDLDQAPVDPGPAAAEHAGAGDQQAPGGVVTAESPAALDESDLDNTETVVFSTRKVFDRSAVAKRMGADAAADMSQAVLTAIGELLAVDPAQRVRDSKDANGVRTIAVGGSVKISARPTDTDSDSLPELLVSWAWEEEELATQALVIINRVLG
ncbi:hypothetical protein GGF43_005040, partial [Coemansia sp. RSA 2618]